MKKLIASGVMAVVLLFGFILFAPSSNADAEATPATCTTTTPAVPGVAPTGPVVDRNAMTVIAGGKLAGVNQFGVEVGLGVMLVESEGKNLASRKVPESIKYPNDGVAPGDHLSIGPFQQQVGMGWFDTVAHGMDPAVQAASFFKHMNAVAGWDQMEFGALAQTIQGSAFGGRYTPRQGEAQALYARLAGKAGTAPVQAPVVCPPPVAPVAPGGTVVAGHWANPLAPAHYTIGSPFGPRGNIGFGAGMHKGQDLMVALVTPVKAVCDGTVTETAWDPWGGGWMVTTDCGGGITTYEMHNSSFVAKAGQVVKAGTVVALSGSTGHSTGPHSHLQIMLNGVAFDPVPWMRDHGVPL